MHQVFQNKFLLMSTSLRSASFLAQGTFPQILSWIFATNSYLSQSGRGFCPGVLTLCWTLMSLSVCFFLPPPAPQSICRRNIRRFQIDKSSQQAFNQKGITVLVGLHQLKDNLAASYKMQSSPAGAKMGNEQGQREGAADSHKPQLCVCVCVCG